MDSTTLPIIITPRLVLRWISEDDVDSLYERRPTAPRVAERITVHVPTREPSYFVR